MSKHFERFGESVSHLDHVGFFNHVGAKVDQAMKIALADFLYFLVIPIRGVEVRVEHPPVQKVFRLREIQKVLVPSVNGQGLVSLIS